MNKKFQSHLNEEEDDLDPDEKALKIFHEAAIRIPAYKAFLSKNNLNHTEIKTVSDFKSKVPLTTKENYILIYELADRCWDGDLSKSHSISASSGSTGQPIFWPRNLKQEIDGAKIHQLILEKVFEVKKTKTLFVNSFGLGNWIAGMYTQVCLYLTRLNDIQFTLTSPGYSQEETFKVVKSLSAFYDQTIISCHPPIIKMMIEQGNKEGIDWSKLNMKFIGAGEGFSENWRNYLLSLVSQKDPFRTIINIYGSADAGLMGFETPLSIALHRETSTNHLLNKKLFSSDRNPYLYQFDPKFKYLESVGGEITITANSTMPLIRYNIHDKGSIISFEDILDEVSKNSLLEILESNQINPSHWRFPFVYIFGRDHYMTSLLGVNIYPENIKAVLEEKSLQPFITGRFIVDKKENEEKEQYLVLNVELRSGQNPSIQLTNKIKELFVSNLKKLNSEYNQVEDKFKEKMHPQVKICKFEDPKYFPSGKIKKMS